MGGSRRGMGNGEGSRSEGGDEGDEGDETVGSYGAERAGQSM